MLAVVGESGSGKTTLLNCCRRSCEPTAGSVRYRMRDGVVRDIYRPDRGRAAHAARAPTGASCTRTRATACAWRVSAGANIGERLMAIGERHYGNIRATAVDGWSRVEIDADRIDDMPRTFSGGMQQRLQIARNLVTQPRLVFMDEPTGGLDVSVQARLLDLLRGLVARSGPGGDHRHPRPRRGAAAWRTA